MELHPSLHTRRSPIQSDIYQMSYWYNWLSWWWAHGCSKHVENWNKHIRKKNCALIWLFTRNKTSWWWHVRCAETCCSIDNLVHVKLVLQTNHHSMSLFFPLRAKALQPVDTCFPSKKCLQKTSINTQDEIPSRGKKITAFKNHLLSLQGRNPICFKQR